MLSNAYFLAKFRFDAAENEPAKNLQNLNFAKFANFANSGHGVARPGARARALVDHAAQGRGVVEPKNAFSKNAFFENFANFWRACSRLYQNEILQ